jgi:hypothetical protein
MVLGGHRQVVLVRPADTTLVLHVLHYPDRHLHLRAGDRLAEEEMLKLVRSQEPQPASHYRPNLPPALGDICLKCLEKKPSWRYPSADALADDLEKFLCGKAKPRKVHHRIGRAIRRRSWIAASNGPELDPGGDGRHFGGQEGNEG